jgi:chromosome segregation ATPase
MDRAIAKEALEHIKQGLAKLEDLQSATLHEADDAPEESDEASKLYDENAELENICQDLGSAFDDLEKLIGED